MKVVLYASGRDVEKFKRLTEEKGYTVVAVITDVRELERAEADAIVLPDLSFPAEELRKVFAEALRKRIPIVVLTAPLFNELFKEVLNRVSTVRDIHELASELLMLVLKLFPEKVKRRKPIWFKPSLIHLVALKLSGKRSLEELDVCDIEAARMYIIEKYVSRHRAGTPIMELYREFIETERLEEIARSLKKGKETSLSYYSFYRLIKRLSHSYLSVEDCKQSEKSESRVV